MKPLIVLHLYYTEMWDEFKNYFDRLDIDFDLIVTITEGNNDISEKIKQSYPNCKIFVLPNKGLDIGPFLYVLKYLKENNLEYSHIVKLHSKKSHYNTGLGVMWRKALMDSLMCTSEVFKSNLDLITNDPTYKMCGSRIWLLPSNRQQHDKTFNKVSVKSPTAFFIGGTMFMSDYKVIVDFFSIEQIDELYNLMPNGYVRDFSHAHDMERIFGFIIEDNGYKIKGV